MRTRNEDSVPCSLSGSPVDTLNRPQLRNSCRTFAMAVRGHYRTLYDCSIWRSPSLHNSGRRRGLKRHIRGICCSMRHADWWRTQLGPLVDARVPFAWSPNASARLDVRTTGPAANANAARCFRFYPVRHATRCFGPGFYAGIEDWFRPAAQIFA